MTPSDAFQLAKNHIPSGMVANLDSLRENEFGFYFNVASEEFLRTGDIIDMPIGSFGVLVDRQTGEVHDLGSAFNLEYWLEAYDRKLHLPNDVIVHSIGDRQRAATALCRLQLTYVVPEVANGVTWNIPKHYNQKDFVRSFESLPTRFEAQQLIFRILEIDAITANTDIEITLEPKNVG